MNYIRNKPKGEVSDLRGKISKEIFYNINFFCEYLDIKNGFYKINKNGINAHKIIFN